MVTREDVESYLFRAGLTHEETEDGLWLVRLQGDDGPVVVISYAPPVVVFTLKVMDAPKDEARSLPLFRTMLEMNASDLSHAAYALEENDVILTASLGLESLDYSEVQGTLDSFGLAVSQHLEVLAAYRDS